MTVDGNPVKLTSHEYRLLSYLMHHTGRVVSRTELVEHLYDQDFDRDSNTIEVFVGRMRKKLGIDVIQTVRGLGYLLAPPAMRANSLALRLFFSATTWIVVILVVAGIVLSGIYRAAVERAFDRGSASICARWSRMSPRRMRPPSASRNRSANRCSNCRCRAGTGR